ncbi:MAG TPA: DUF3667 domain-containing protein [Steroidobacteraceae bacterium]|nr:DUF3667 domain-containing protein [Steroidobacteraceae bacterium]
MTPEAPERQAPALSAVKRCLNCGAELTGRYCANCSQAADVHVPSTRELIHEALEGMTHSDSRLWRTLHLLWFKPGKLTQEFVAGRRAAYLPPFRLYLVLSILFFLVASMSNTHANFVRFDNETSEAAGVAAPQDCAKVNATQFSAQLFGRDWAPRIKHACGEIARDNGANLLHVALATAPKAMFIFLPLIAFLHMLLYWRPRHRYAEHLLFFIHLHAFFFSVMTLVILSADAADAWPRLNPVLRFLPLLLWSMPLYAIVGMRRVFGRGWMGALLKAGALFAAYMVVLIITLGGVFVYAVLQL